MPNDPTGRALQLLSLLQTHRFWRADELAERLEITQRTVRRDVDRLRGLGYPVDSTTGKYGGYRLEIGAHLPPLILDDEEAVAVAVGLRQAAEAAVVGMEEASLRALTKIEPLLPARLRRRVSALHSSVTSLRRTDDEAIDPEALSVLATACRDREMVRFDYRRRDGEGSCRLVEPHRLVTVGRRWYLVGWDEERDDWRLFRLDRLRQTRAIGRHFVSRAIPGGDAAAFVANSLDPMSRPEATVLVRATVAEIGGHLRWIDHTVLDDGADRCRLLVRAADPGRLTLDIARLALAAPVTVVEPAEIVDRIDSLARNLTGRVR